MLNGIKFQLELKRVSNFNAKGGDNEINKYFIKKHFN